ncbi:MAP1A [Acrasis kona]|uniref:MAP1A n=1 Tax=Acrasis kona TaxID=1008807 RepID=A0AAW2Z4V2_9EUKA
MKAKLSTIVLVCLCLLLCFVHTKTDDDKGASTHGHQHTFAYFRSKSYHFYSQFSCDRKCKLKKLIRKISKKISQLKKKNNTIKSKLRINSKRIKHIQKKLDEVNNFNSKQKKDRITKKYNLKLSREMKRRHILSEKSLIVKKSFATSISKRKIAHELLQKFYDEELQKSAVKSKKLRDELKAQSSKKVDNHSTLNQVILRVLRAERKFYHKSNYKLKRVLHIVKFLVTKREHILSHLKRSREIEAKTASNIKKLNEDVKDLQSLIKAATTDQKKVKIQDRLNTALLHLKKQEEKLSKVQVRVKKLEELSQKVNQELNDTIDKKITNVKVTTFPKQLRDDILSLKDRDPKLVQKIDASNSFFLLTPHHSESRYVCTTTSDLGNSTTVVNKNIPSSLQDVFVNPLLCYYKERAQVNVSVSGKELKIKTQPGAWRSAKIVFRKNSKRILVNVKKADVLAQPKIAEQTVHIDADVTKYIESHKKTANEVIKSFLLERTVVPSEPFVLNIKI